jgi:uncharacterized protein
MALEMRPECERCDRGLGHAAVAFICSYECTWCATCAGSFDYRCPNCEGELLRRPIRIPKCTMNNAVD